MINFSSEHNHLKYRQNDRLAINDHIRDIYIILPENYEGTEDTRHYRLEWFK
jgi:hypothetical protein